MPFLIYSRHVTCCLLITMQLLEDSNDFVTWLHPLHNLT